MAAAAISAGRNRAQPTFGRSASMCSGHGMRQALWANRKLPWYDLQASRDPACWSTAGLLSQSACFTGGLAHNPRQVTPVRVLEYSGLDTTRVRASYEKVKAALARDDFRAADVKKLVSVTHGKFYRARLDLANQQD